MERGAKHDALDSDELDVDGVMGAWTFYCIVTL